MGDVHYLKPVLTEAQPNIDAIHKVEDLLRRVRAGEAVAVAFAFVTPEGAVGTSYTEGRWFHQLASGVNILSKRLT